MGQELHSERWLVNTATSRSKGDTHCNRELERDGDKKQRLRQKKVLRTGSKAVFPHAGSMQRLPQDFQTLQGLRTHPSQGEPSVATMSRITTQHQQHAH